MGGLKASLLQSLLATTWPAFASPILPNENPTLLAHDRDQLSTSNGKAIYINVNNAQKNAVAAIKINADGTLGETSITETGGVGGSGVSGTTNQTAMPDSLFSQSALTVAGKVRSDPFPFLLVLPITCTRSGHHTANTPLHKHSTSSP